MLLELSLSGYLAQGNPRIEGQVEKTVMRWFSRDQRLWPVFSHHVLLGMLASYCFGNRLKVAHLQEVLQAEEYSIHCVGV